MRGAVLHGPRELRFEERDMPAILKPTDAIVRNSATCVCGSDLWPYRGINPVPQATPMGHEYCGIVEDVGSAVKTIKPGQFVIGSFGASDNTCPHCRYGYQTSCAHREWISTAQAPQLRIPLADGTLALYRVLPLDGSDRLPSPTLITVTASADDGSAGSAVSASRSSRCRRASIRSTLNFIGSGVGS